MKKKGLWGELEQRIGYTFHDLLLLEQAMTHASRINDRQYAHMINNERLEFLGDAVLQLCTSRFIYVRFPHLAEGDMTKIRATVVCESELAHKAASLDLGRFLLLGKGEEMSGGRARSSILADAFEALIGAIYLDGGYDKAACFAMEQLGSTIEAAGQGQLLKDYKTALQEIIQQDNTRSVSYTLLAEEGPDHNKTFTVQAESNGETLGVGRGKSKKDAEQAAAKDALNQRNE